MSQPSTKPYLIRAIHQWCGDHGFTPYLAVIVDAQTMVPREYVRNGEIVLNVSMTATHKLDMGNEYISFQARFNGQAREISIPVGAVSAIYARENGQGMSFEVTRAEEPSAQAAEAPAAKAPARRAPRLKAVDSEPAEAADAAGPSTQANEQAEGVEALRPSPAPAEGPAADPASSTGLLPAGSENGDGDPAKPTGGKPRLTRIK